MPCEQEHLVIGYVVDALHEGELGDFESHLVGCAGCRDEVARLSTTTGELAADVSTDPPAALRAAILEAIADVPQDDRAIAPGLDQHRRSLHGRPALLLAAVAVVVVIVGLVGIGFSGQDDVVDAADVVVTELDGAPGSLEVAWSAEQDRVHVTGSDLVDLDPSKAYALWFLLDGDVAAAGLFASVDGAVSATIEVPDIDGLGFGVTIEPAAGSVQPTTDVVYSALL